MLILIAILIVVPMIGTQFGLSLDVLSSAINAAVGFVLKLILLLTGNG